MKEKTITVLLLTGNADEIEFLTGQLGTRFYIHYSLDGSNGIKKIQEQGKPDFILINSNLKNTGCYEFIDFINSSDEYQDIPYIIFSTTSDKEDRIKAFKKGAIDFIQTPFNIEELILQVESIVKFKDKIIENDFNKMEKDIFKILDSENDEQKNGKNDYLKKVFQSKKISKKEKEIIEFVVKGFEYKEIAGVLNISFEAAKKRIHRLYKKLGCNNKLDLINILKNKYDK